MARSTLIVALAAMLLVCSPFAISAQENTLAPVPLLDEEFLASVEFIRGDMDGDNWLGVDDAVYALNFLFIGGPVPPCLAAADADGDDAFNGLLEVLFILRAFFLGEESPPEPFPDCGLDPDTTINLGCNAPSCP